MACPAGGDHDWTLQTYTEEYYPPHSGEWGGVQFGHQCCHQCAGQVNLGFIKVGDGRCHGACGGVCNFTKKRTATRALCKKCGTLGAKAT